MASIYDIDPDKDLNEAYRYAQLTPDQQIALKMRLAEKGVQEGIQRAGRGALGLPAVGSPEQHRAQAAREIQELAKRVAPGTEEFYAEAAKIFTSHGLVAEAEKMMQAGRALDVAKAGESPTMKLQHTLDTLKKRLTAGDTSVQPGIDAVNRQLAALGVKTVTAPALHDFTKLLRDSKEATTPEDKAKYAQAIKAWLVSKESANLAMTPAQVAAAALGVRKEDRADRKDDAREAAVQKAIVSSLQSVVKSANHDIANAADLLNHPGLSGVVGPKVGIPGGGRIAAFVRGGETANAHALLLNVLAGTFMTALQDLKALSPKGVTGLGQLTELEGTKVQNAKAALDPQQEVKAFQGHLKNYIAELTSARIVAVGELTNINAPIPVAPPRVPVTPPVSVPKPTPRPRPGTEATLPKNEGGWSATKRN